MGQLEEQGARSGAQEQHGLAIQPPRLGVGAVQAGILVLAAARTDRHERAIRLVFGGIADPLPERPRTHGRTISETVEGRSR